MLIVHMAQHGTKCLYRRHDQEAGFSNYSLHKLDTDYFGPFPTEQEPYKISECYMYDFHQERYLPMMRVTNLMCNEAMVDLDPQQLKEVVDKLVMNTYIIRSDIYIHNLKLVPPKPDHYILCAVWDGVPLFLDSMGYVRSGVWVYTGDPALFRAARWWHTNRTTIEKYLLKILPYHRTGEGSKKRKKY
jgi:hypothetical protein